jgi:hypothetical protein
MFQVILTDPHTNSAIPTPSGLRPSNAVYLRILLFLESHSTNEQATNLECTDIGRFVTKVDGGVNGDWYADS